MTDLLSRLDKKLLNIVAQAGCIAAELGFHAYLVGGPVRDLILDRFNGDLDITVEGHGMKVAEKFSQLYQGARLVSYPAFKTASVELPFGVVVDFATARQESYSKGGVFPKVVPSTIKDDLFRRDFTINAIAIDITPHSWGKVVDPFEGLKDLRSKRIRILHQKSFLDDPTRIVRAARFKSRLGFAMERETLKALKEAIEVKALDTIKPQRYMKEFEKILREKQPRKAMEYLKSWNAYRGGKSYAHG